MPGQTPLVQQPSPLKKHEQRTHVGLIIDQDEAAVMESKLDAGGQWDSEESPVIVSIKADGVDGVDGVKEEKGAMNFSLNSSFTPVRPTSSKRTDSAGSGGRGTRSRSARQMAATLVESLPIPMSGKISSE